MPLWAGSTGAPTLPPSACTRLKMIGNAAPLPAGPRSPAISGTMSAQAPAAAAAAAPQEWESLLTSPVEENPALVTQRLMRDLSLENAEQAAAEVAGFSLLAAQAAEGVAAQVGCEGRAGKLGWQAGWQAL